MELPMADEVIINAGNAHMGSPFYVQLFEHVFISKVYQEAWHYFGKTVEVLRS